MNAIVRDCRNAVAFVRLYREARDPFYLEAALYALKSAFGLCNRLGRHDLRARVCRMRNWVSAELARVKR